MKTCTLLFVLIGIAGVSPLAAQNLATPVITDANPKQATASCCSVSGIPFTIIGQNFSQPNTITSVTLTGPDFTAPLNVVSNTGTQIQATLTQVPPVAGSYSLIVDVAPPPVFVAAAPPPVASGPYPITFNEPVTPVVGANYTAYVGVPFSQQLSVGGGTPPYTWTFSNTPLPGLSLSSAGVLSGTLAQPATLSVGVTVADAFQSSASYGVTLYVEPPPITITSPTNLPTAYRSEPYSFTFTATGAPLPFMWGLESNLPGVMMNEQTGQISVTPTELGQFDLWIYVSSSSGNSGNGQFTLRVIDRPPLALPPAELPAATAGQLYTYQFIAQDGKPPYRFSGKLPPEFTLSASGVLSGTPAAEGTLSFNIDVSDAGGASANQLFALKVQPPLFRITTAALSNGVLGQTYSHTLAATGGVAPLTWSVKTGALPEGLTLDPATGKITGSPIKGGLFRMEFQVADAKQLIATRPLSILVVVPMIEITTQSLPEGHLNQPYSATLAANGGEPPISWSVTQGSLPDGLTLDAAGSITGKPSAKGTFAFTVTATDPSGQKMSRDYEIAVTNAPVNIITTALSGATTGASYTAAMTAEGGTGSYVWSVAAGSLPPGLSLDAGTGAIAGTPALPGEHSITIEVKDDAGASAVRSYVLRVAPPVVAATLSVTSTGAGQQGSAGVTIAKYPAKVTGQLIMTFTPDAGYSDDPAAQFASGGRTVPIEIDAGATNFFVPVQVGTTPGLIRITATFTAAGADVTPQPAPERTIRIEPAAPVISSITVTRNTGGFTVTVTGFATARDITSATFRLGASGGNTLQGSEFTVQVGQAFSAWFASETARQFGGQFTYTQPFSVQGDSNAITSVTVTLSNSSGASQPMTATF